jgi:hypothetical protein
MNIDNLNKEEKTKSLLVMVVGFLVLYFIAGYFWEKEIKTFLYISGAIGVLSLMSETISNLILKVWFKIAMVLGWINTRIILGLVFFVFLTPFAWLQRLFVRKNYLSLKDSETTVFHTRNHQYKPEDFDNIW